MSAFGTCCWAYVCQLTLSPNATIERLKRSCDTPTLMFWLSSPNCRSARRRPASVTRFSLLIWRRPPSHAQPASGLFRSSAPLVKAGVPLLVYSTVVNGEVGMMVGDSRKNQLRLQLACRSSLMLSSPPNQKVAPGLMFQYCTSSRYGRASSRNWEFTSVALVTTLLASSCMLVGMKPTGPNVRPTRLASMRSFSYLAREYIEST